MASILPRLCEFFLGDVPFLYGGICFPWRIVRLMANVIEQMNLRFFLWLSVCCVVLSLCGVTANAQGLVLDQTQVLFDGVNGIDTLNSARAVDVSPDGLHLYVASSGDGAVSVFSRSPSNGSLTFVEAEISGLNGVTGLAGVNSVAVAPDGSHVYLTSEIESSVTVFSRDVNTGELSFIETQFDNSNGVDGIGGAQWVIVSPDGAHVYVVGIGDDAIAAFSRNQTTGALTFVEAKFDGLDGVNGLNNARMVIASPDGAHIYTASSLDDAVVLFSRNLGTGQLTFVKAEFNGAGGGPYLRAANSVEFSPDGAHLYMTSYFGSAVSLYSRNAATGEVTFVEAKVDGIDGGEGLQASLATQVSPGRCICVRCWFRRSCCDRVFTRPCDRTTDIHRGAI